MANDAGPQQDHRQSPSSFRAQHSCNNYSRNESTKREQSVCCGNSNDVACQHRERTSQKFTGIPSPRSNQLLVDEYCIWKPHATGYERAFFD